MRSAARDARGPDSSEQVETSDEPAEVGGDASGAGYTTEDAGDPLEMTRDAGPETLPPLDASMTDVQDAGLDGSDAEVDAVDAAVGLFDADALPAEGGGGVLACASPDVERWARAHQPDGGAIRRDCTVTCDGGAACTDDCMRSSLGLDTCRDCTLRETACGFTWCSSACAPDDTDETCLACLCQADCVHSFETCAGRTLSLCGPPAFAAAPLTTDVPLRDALLVFGDSRRGAFVAGRCAATRPSTITSYSHLIQLPAGPSRLISISLPGRELFLHYSENCAEPPCTARAYPLYDDGSYGQPVFEERWEAGFKDFEIFKLNGRTYLVRLAGIAASGQGPNIWIDEMGWSASEGPLTRTTVLRATFPWAPSLGFDNVEALEIDQTVFLVLPDLITGTLRVLRVQESAGALSLFELPALEITRGWDVFEAFKSFGTWYLFGFKRGTHDTTVEEPAGIARMWRPTLGTSGEFGLFEVYRDYWGSGLSGMKTFTDSLGHAYLITYSLDAGVALMAQLGADEKQFIHDIFMVPPGVAVQGAGHTAEILKQGQW